MLKILFTCRSGSMSLRQVYFATLDLMLHSQYQPGKGGSVFRSEVVQRVIEENTVMPPLPEDRFLNGFQHIFAGGYSAGDLPVSCSSMTIGSHASKVCGWKNKKRLVLV